MRLLRECDFGLKMAIASIDDVLEHINSKSFEGCLKNSRNEYLKANVEIQQLLVNCGDVGRTLGAVAKGLGKVKTGVKLAVKESDATVADLITDGCNMGVKLLCGYLNKYKAASDEAKDMTRRLVKLTEDLCVETRPFL